MTVDERVVFFFNDTATTEIYPLSLHAALPISRRPGRRLRRRLLALEPPLRRPERAAVLLPAPVRGPQRRVPDARRRGGAARAQRRSGPPPPPRRPDREPSGWVAPRRPHPRLRAGGRAPRPGPLPPPPGPPRWAYR